MRTPGAEPRAAEDEAGIRSRSQTQQPHAGGDVAPIPPDAPVGRGPQRRLVADPVRYCLQPRHVRRTVTIAILVGVLLTAVNQLDVVLSGDATAATWAKTALNFVIPFVVANLGLLGARRETR